MQIAYIAAGAAGMYCGSCLHDNTLARALMRRGEGVVLIPTYTPLRTDEQDASVRRVFFGGLNVYLGQSVPWFRRAPRALRRLLDSPALLRFVTRGSGSVDPSKLGPMTVSMLRGEQGGQQGELEELVDWLLDEVRPEVVHLSNSMLLGMARRIAERCGPPVVCALSGEDLFLEGLVEPYYQQARELLRQRAAEVHGFTALNGYYADFMSEYLSVPRERVHVVLHGLDLEGYPDAPRPPRDGSPARIGYLARVCPEKGLHLLVEACERLAADPSTPPFEVHAAGYLGKSDRKYLADIERRAKAGPLRDRFRYVGEPDRTGKIEFLSGVDLFSTPTIYRESKGLPTLEAMACGAAVVQPDHGSFPEMVSETGGGRLFPAGAAGALTSALRGQLLDPEGTRSLGEAGRRVVRERFHADAMAEDTLALYRRLIAGARGSTPQA